MVNYDYYEVCISNSGKHTVPGSLGSEQMVGPLKGAGSYGVKAC